METNQKVDNLVLTIPHATIQGLINGVTTLQLICDPITLVLTLGNLSTDVFEPRTATGNRTFSFLAWFCSSPWRGKLLFLCLRFDVTNAMASKRSKEGKIQLPVDVRGSKTSVLKFPNSVYACVLRVGRYQIFKSTHTITIFNYRYLAFFFLYRLRCYDVTVHKY